MQARAKASVYYLAKTVLGMDKLVKDLHLPFANFAQMEPWNGGPNPGSLRKLAVMPRGHFKSSIISRTLPIWKVIHDPNTTIAIVSGKETNAKQWIRWIGNQIEYNEGLNFVFPDLKKGDKWDEMEKNILRDGSTTDDVQATFSAYTIKGGMASQHHQHGILDDVLNEKTAYSEVERQRAISLVVHFENILKSYHESTMLIVGTPWPGYDVIDHVMEHECAFGDRMFWTVGAKGHFDMSPELYAKEYEHLNLIPHVRDRLEKDGVIFAEETPLRKLEKIRRQDPQQYYYQLLCRPPEDEDNGFATELIRDFVLRSDDNCLRCDCHKDHDHQMEDMIVVLLCDPALSIERSACESAIILVARHPGCGCRFILDEWGGRVDTTTLIDQLCTMGMKWRDYLVRAGIEAVAFQKTLAPWLRERQGRGEFPTNVSIVPVMPNRRDKEYRCLGQAPYVKDGLWHKRPFMTNTSETGSVIWQIGVFPGAPMHRDRIDAWAYCDDVWEDIQPPRKAQGAKAQRRAATVNRRREVADFQRMRKGR